MKHAVAYLEKANKKIREEVMGDVVDAEIPDPEPFAVVKVIDHIPTAAFVSIFGIYVGSYGGDDAIKNAKELADQLNAAFEKAVARMCVKTIKYLMKESGK